MNINKIMMILKERWKFYLRVYLLAYLIPIILYGVPSWQYLFPIRIIGIVGALGIGTAFYYGSKKTPVFEGLYRTLKYVAFIIIFVLSAFGLKEVILSATGVDITPFIGIQKSTK